MQRQSSPKTTPAEDFRRIRIAAAAWQLRHFLETGTDIEQVCDWFRSFHAAIWHHRRSETTLDAMGIVATVPAGRLALQAWIEAAEALTADTPPAGSLAGFLATHRRSKLDQITEALRGIIAAGGGSWMGPEAGLHSPGTHLVEISCMGITGRGASELEATRNWVRLAEYAVRGEAAA